MIYLFTLLPVLLALSFLLKPRFIVTKVLVNTFRIVGTLAFTLLVLRLYVFDIYKIPSISMEQTLKVGDKIIIRKAVLPQKNELAVFKGWSKKNPMIMVKRVVAAPGDSMSIKNGRIYCNNKLTLESETVQHPYYYNNRISYDTLMVALKRSQVITRGEERNIIDLTEAEFNSLNRKIAGVDLKLANSATNQDLYPKELQQINNRDNFNPFWVPKKGKTISITKNNLLWYEKMISHENDDFKIINDSTISLNDKLYCKYTFKDNYYYMMGDNRHRSVDSRFWGFVPEDHILGKVILGIRYPLTLKAKF